MSQRAIRTDLLEFALQYGFPQGEKTVLNEKAIHSVLLELKRLEKTALEAQKKGGIVVVQSGEMLITTYRLDSFKREGH